LCAGYYDEIKNPMDLATVRTKLRRRGGGAGYAAAGEWLADMRLMLANALRYNRAQVRARARAPRRWGAWPSRGASRGPASARADAARAGPPPRGLTRLARARRRT
jgi:hypothetical protein